MQTYDIAAYVWPAYTGDEPRSRMFWPQGMGEWQSVKDAVKKFPEHNWPRKPLWGYVNEADPYVMEMELAAAADHGVNVFIYDWYWYDHRPFLEQCLNNGYLKAQNNHRVQFYLMWANHNVNNTWDIRLSHDQDNLIWDGAVDRATFETICLRLIHNYFSQPTYYKLNGKPVFMIYDTDNLLRGLGGAENTRRALDWFREQCIKAGFPGLHLQMTLWSELNYNLSGVDGAEKKLGSTAQTINALGYDSMSHYQFAHFVDIDRKYSEIMVDVCKEWTRIETAYSIPYFPHVSIGWDNNPRFQCFRKGIVLENTPAAFESALWDAKAQADKLGVRLITINSWNEWTETSYLLPDDLYGYGYLEAVRRVFLEACNG